MLPGLDVLVLRRGVVEHLDLHALIRSVAFERRAETDAVVAARTHFEVHAQDEVGVLLDGEEIPAAVGRADDPVAFDHVTRADPADQLPSIEIPTIEQRFESRLGLSGGEISCQKNTGCRNQRCKQLSFQNASIELKRIVSGHSGWL